MKKKRLQKEAAARTAEAFSKRIPIVDAVYPSPNQKIEGGRFNLLISLFSHKLISLFSLWQPSFWAQKCTFYIIYLFPVLSIVAKNFKNKPIYEMCKKPFQNSEGKG